MDKHGTRHALVGPPRLWRLKRDFQIAFLVGNGLQPRHRLLDLGCGTLRGGIPLIDYLDAGHYHGIDVRPEVIEEARRELAEQGLAHKAPVLACVPDLATAGPVDAFDYIWAFSVLIHMGDDVLDVALAFVARQLAGTFYANVNIGERQQAGWQGFPVVWRALDFYRDRAARVGLDVADLGSLHDVGHVSGVPRQDAQRMLAFRRC